MQKDTAIPIYKKLTDYYRSRILNQELAPGNKIDSINRIMERHRVSRETAKQVQELLRRENLIVSIPGKGSFITPQAPIKKIWGFIAPTFSSNIENLILHLESETQKRNIKLIHYLTYNDPTEEAKLVGTMIREGFEAVIVVPNSNEMLTANFYRHLITGRTKVILTDHTMAGSWFHYAIQSYDLGIRRAVDYLASRNTGNLLLVQNDIWKGRDLLNELIEQSFKEIARQKLPDRDVHVISNARGLSLELIKKKRIGGILSCSDIDSIKVLGRLKCWGLKIPEKVSLVSYGNTELTAFFEPSITVVDSCYGEMARHTAGLIENSGEDINKQFVIQPKLIVRNT
ncbi:substrate-binding domain-containing protein [Bacteroidota bacterium]